MRVGETARVGGADETLRIYMRKLWEDHITWTRMFIVSTAGGLGDVAAVTDRLLRNQVEIGNAIAPYFGAAKGTELTNLLKGHITTAAALVNAAKAGNDAQVRELDAAWRVNSDSIADFLSTANPTYWPKSMMRDEMRAHLDLTLRQAQARLRGDWAEDIAAYEAVHEQALRMADMLSQGIIRQFPGQVAGRARH